MKKILIITILFLTNCGYKPLLINNTSPDLIFSEISTFGNKKINRNVISLLKIQENKNDLSLDKLILKTEKNNIEISKDSKGRVNTYRLIIGLEFSIDNNKGKVEKKSFEKSFTSTSYNGCAPILLGHHNSGFLMVIDAVFFFPRNEKPLWST